MRPIRLATVLLTVVVLAACTPDSAPTGLAVDQTPALAKGSTGSAAPGFYTGTWVQVEPQTFTSLGTTYSYRTFVYLTQTGSTFSGSADRWVTYYDANGAMLSQLKLDGNMRVSGNQTTTGAYIAITRIGEAKRSLGLTLTLSADSTTLVNNSTAVNILGITALQR